MKRLLLFCITVVLGYLPGRSEIPEKIYVVYDADMFSDYNFSINDAVKKNWNLCAFDWLTYDLFLKKISDTHSYFLFLSDAQVVLYGKEFKLQMLNLAKGSASGRIEDMQDLANFPLASLNGKCEDYCRVLPLALRFIQSALANPEYQKIQLGSNAMESIQSLIVPAENISLYFSRNQLSADVRDIQKIKSIWPGRVILIEDEKLETKIQNAVENSGFYHSVLLKGNAGNMIIKLVLSGEGNAIYFFSLTKYKSKSDGLFSANDFKEMK